MKYAIDVKPSGFDEVDNPVFQKLVRVWLVAMVLTVGALQVSRCTGRDDPAEAARDQYDRMHGWAAQP